MISGKRPMRVGLIAASLAALALGLAAIAVAATYTGSRGPDTINASEGNDTITSGFGNDTINAGGGNDSVNSGPGADQVDSGTFNVEDPNALCPTQPNDDFVDGAGGPDNLVGGAGDVFFCDPDNDVIKGSGGADTIDVQDADFPDGYSGGADTANGGRGNDTCIGDSNDTFISCEHVNP